MLRSEVYKLSLIHISERDPDYFMANMVVLPEGRGLTWPEEIDYSADFLRKVAFPFGLPSD